MVHEAPWAPERDDPGPMPAAMDAEALLVAMDSEYAAVVAEDGPPAAMLETIDAGGWCRSEPPERRWIVPGWMLAGALHLFGGKGGDGKSLFLQQVATSIASGVAWLPGFDPAESGPVLLVNAEDDEGELHRRQRDIVAAIGCDWRDIAGQLHVAALVGAEADRLQLGRFDDRRFIPGPALHAIERKAAAIGAVAIMLDNRAQLYPGDLNDNAAVTSFCNALTGLAKRTGAALVLATHPAKGDGSEFAGAAAWENAARVRWWLEREEDGSDIRRLKRGKSNYSGSGTVLEFQWERGAFVPLNTGALGLSEREAKANAAFLACLRECRRQQRNVTATQGPGYAPKAFEAMPAARGFAKAEMVATMERLLATGRIIARAEMPWRNRRDPVFGVAEAGQ